MDRINFSVWSAEIAVLLKDCKKGKRIFGIEEENFVQEQKLKKILYLHSTENKYAKWKKIFYPDNWWNCVGLYGDGIIGQRQ